MKELRESSDIVIVPKPYAELSSRRILTCERLRGTPFSEVLRNVRGGRPDFVTAMGFDPDRLAHNLLETVLTQIFRNQFFHADIHPGNLLALPGDRIGLLDMALCDSLDPIVRRGTARYLMAVADEDPEGMYRAIAEVLRVTEDTDLESFRAEFTAATRNLLRDRARTADESEQGHVVRAYMVSLMQIARAKGLLVPPGMLSLYRSLLAAETIAVQISQRADLLRTGRAFFQRLQLESVLSAPEATQFQRAALQIANLLQNGPGQLGRLLEDLADERFVLHVRGADAAERRRQHNARAQLTTLGLVAVSVAILFAGAPAVPLWGWLPVRPLLLIALVVIYAALALQWRRLR
jgi:ubiquinone biosynthesis protein